MSVDDLSQYLNDELSVPLEYCEALEGIMIHYFPQPISPPSSFLTSLP